jgi:hypothetical protein
MLGLLGYDIDSEGNINFGRSQMAVITMQDVGDGSILRIHGNTDTFFFSGDFGGENVFYPKKISSKFVYFSDGSRNDFKVPKTEFKDSLLYALSEYKKLVSKENLRG